MDKLVEYINAHQSRYGVRVQYSLVSEFFAALHAQNLTWSTRGAEDFFPYIDTGKTYWTGYFTSRSALKGYVRSREAVARTAEMLHVLSRSPWGPRVRADADDLARLADLRAANAEATHHDAVSGTSEPHVNAMYADHLRNGTERVQPVIVDAIATLAAIESGTRAPFTPDWAPLMANLSSAQGAAIAVYNPTSWTLRRFVSVPVQHEVGLVVLDAATGAVVPSDVLPAVPTAAGPCALPGTCGRPAITAPYTLHFAVDVPPLGFATYTVGRVDGADREVSPSSVRANGTTIENSRLRLRFDPATGFLASITDRAGGASAAVQQNFYEYESVTDLFLRNVPAGAYIMHPRGPARPLAARTKHFEIVSGRYVAEARQVFTEPCSTAVFSTCGVSQVFRLYDAANGGAAAASAEILLSVGPLNVNSNFAARFVTSMNTSRTIYTDDNCFSSHRRAHQLQPSDPIGGNYLPATCAAFMRDAAADSQLTLLTDRARAAGVSDNGVLEMMYHRRVLSTDFRSPMLLDDTDRMENVQTLLLFGNATGSTQLRKTLQYQLQFPPALLYAPVRFGPARSVGALQSALRAAWPYRARYSPLRAELPPNVHILSLMHLNASLSTMVLRLVHLYEAGEHAELSRPVSVDLGSLFGFAALQELDERSLNVVLPVSEVDTRWTWRTADRTARTGAAPIGHATALRGTVVTLNPAEIRTFLATFRARA